MRSRIYERVCPSVGRSVRRSVKHELKSCKSAFFDQNYWQYERGRILCRVYGLVPWEEKLFLRCQKRGQIRDTFSGRQKEVVTDGRTDAHIKRCFVAPKNPLVSVTCLVKTNDFDFGPFKLVHPGRTNRFQRLQSFLIPFQFPFFPLNAILQILFVRGQICQLIVNLICFIWRILTTA